MTVTATDSAWVLPIVDGPAAAFSLVQRACNAAGFDEPGICDRLGIAGIVDFKSRREGRVEGKRVGDALEVLVDLFMDQISVSAERVRQALGDDVVEALVVLGLLRADPGEHTSLTSTMLLYPTAGVLLTSDRTHLQLGDNGEPPPDIVYPSITRSASTFLRMLPQSPCDAFLELCAGSGVAALSMATRARHVWSLDIAERATRVAQFNVRLNGFDNVTTAQGDLFEPVRGLTFDRIVAHPPYVPSFEQRVIYRDGGADGELITRRIVSELPAFLRPGGRYVCNCIATDRTGAALEVRLRDWLGAARDEFDIVLAVTSTEHPSEFYFKNAINGGMSFADAERRHVAFRDMQVELLVFCAFVIERHAWARAPGTLRLTRSRQTTGRELEQLCDWHARRDAPDLANRMLAAFPHIDPAARLQTTQRLAGDRWGADDCTFETTWPFATTLQCPKDVAHVLARCDGRRTLRQVIVALRQKGLLNARVPDDAVLRTLATCVIAGAVHLEERPPSTQ